MSRHRRWYAYTGRFRPVWVAAAGTGRSQHTIRTWAKNGLLPVACDLRTREIVVDLDEAAVLADERGTRRRNRRRAG